MTVTNTGDFKHNHIVEIVPICKDDLVVIPRELARNLADISPLVLVKGISASVCVQDPLTGESKTLASNTSLTCLLIYPH